MCSRSIRNGDSGPSEQRQLLLDRVRFLLSPKQQRRRRLVIVQLRVLISLVADAMPRSTCARQKSCGGSAVKVVDHVVTSCSYLPCNARSRYEAAAIENHDVVEVWMIVEHGRDPVFHQNVDLSAWQEASQREERRCR